MSKFLYDGPLEDLEAHGAGGPKTIEGKDRSSQNSTTHGCTAKKTLIKGESAEEFEELLKDWMEDYRPARKRERSLVEDAAREQWALMRNRNRYHELEQSLEDKKVLEWTEEDHKKMMLMTRYRASAERSFSRAVAMLEQMCTRQKRRAEERAQGGDEKRPGETAEVVEEDGGAEVEVAAEAEGEERSADETPKTGEAIHVLDQWVDVAMEDGKAVTRLEPSNEQLLEDRVRMEPAPEQVCRRFHFQDGIPDEYAWAFETEEQRHTRKWGIQQISVERWLAALKRERVTGHLSDTGEDLETPKRRTWCVCEVCMRTAEIGRRRREEMGK